ncbi:MAG: hypothetical protein IID61_15205, partial [SAR324 cluster bacterium]|nr:hypothetical protein [SAR324 cluster bacterium]
MQTIAELIKKRVKSLGFDDIKECARVYDIPYELLRKVISDGHIPKDKTLLFYAGKLELDANELIATAYQQKAPEGMQHMFSPRPPIPRPATEGRMAPVLGVAACGEWLESYQLEPDQYEPVELPDPDAFFVIAEGESMIGGNIPSGAYLLVNRDAHACQGGSRDGLYCDPGSPDCPDGGTCDPSYVKLYDDKDTGHGPGSCSCFPCDPLCVNADPSLASGTVLQVSSLLDGLAGNDDGSFDAVQQPMAEDPDIELTSVLPDGGAFSLLIPQIAEDGGHGYLRLFADVAKTTEDADSGNDDPAVDALNAYRTISNLGPWFPTPGRTTRTTSPP